MPSDLIEKRYRAKGGVLREITPADWLEEDRGFGTPCWIWRGHTRKRGYAFVCINYKKKPAHRAVFELYVGLVPEGLELDHLCRVRDCVRPEHLEPVTRKENLRRGNSPSAIAARTDTCLRGHENEWYIRSNGWRYCKVCAREKWHAR